MQTQTLRLRKLQSASVMYTIQTTKSAGWSGDNGSQRQLK